jgi:5'-methylthioadenosine phosphorylase
MRAIIGGSGLGQIPELRLTRREVVRTPFGDPSCALSFGMLGDHEVVFLARHGYGHTLAPHQINYRANLWALHEVGADAILSVATVGGIREDLSPGQLVLPDQLIDYTFGRASTFFEGPDNPVTHVDFTWLAPAGACQCDCRWPEGLHGRDLRLHARPPTGNRCRNPPYGPGRVRSGGHDRHA